MYCKWGKRKIIAVNFRGLCQTVLLVKVGWRLCRRLGSEEGKMMGGASWGT